MKLQNKRVKIFLQNGFVYRGYVTDEDTHFLWIDDEVKNTVFMLRRDDISNLEVKD